MHATRHASATAAMVAAAIALVSAHGRDPRYVEPVPLTANHVTRVLAVSRSELGLSGSKRKAVMKATGGRTCAVGSLFALDVDDQYAYDVDEPIDVTVTYVPALTTAAFAVAWDRNGGDGSGVSTDIQPDSAAALGRVTLRLDRARLAGQGILNTDLAIGARNQGVLAVCNVAVARSNATPAASATGRIHLEVIDAGSNRGVAARVGLYDSSSRIPLPSKDALSVHRFADEARLQWLNRRTFWASDSRQAFYVSTAPAKRRSRSVSTISLRRAAPSIVSRSAEWTFARTRPRRFGSRCNGMPICQEPDGTQAIRISI